VFDYQPWYFTPLQLPFVYGNPACDGCAQHDAEERKNNATRRFGQQKLSKEKLGVFWTFL